MFLDMPKNRDCDQRGPGPSEEGFLACRRIGAGPVRRFPVAAMLLPRVLGKPLRLGASSPLGCYFQHSTSTVYARAWAATSLAESLGSEGAVS